MQPMTPEDKQDQTNLSSQMDAVSGPHLSIDPPTGPAVPENNQPLFYTQEDDLDLHLPLVDDQEDQAGQSSPFVLPFQNSAAMPTIAQMDQANAQKMRGQPLLPPTPARTRRSPSQVVKILLIVCVVLITLIGSCFFILAQSTTSSHPTQGNGGQTNGTPGISPVTTHPTQGIQTNKTMPTPRPTATSLSALPTMQLLNQLGWTQAGLTLSDAFEALRTSAAFTDREMSYDYRAIGTPVNHSETLTSSMFLLTSGGKVRFVQNDKREINNTLYNQIQTGKIIQQVINVQPTLVQLQGITVQGTVHLFAWMDVSFGLFQSKIDSTSGNRVDAIEQNATAGQPRLHHLIVVLMRVSPQSQGTNAPMGGTGWLVNTYALDANGLPAIATTPSL